VFSVFCVDRPVTPDSKPLHVARHTPFPIVQRDALRLAGVSLVSDRMQPLDPDLWRTLSPYLDEALDLAPEQRERWLESLQEKDPGAAHVRVLLDGSAATVMDVIKFYDRRFQARFTKQEQADLLAFLMAL